ncbi:MAG: glutaredoxin family protein [Oscillospiraceae bacterium]|nr:glutaredoxin family protein [Oscillospiraceae bacterium]
MLKIFSSDSCGYCRKLKAYLDEKRVRYDVIDVNESEENYRKLIDISGQTGIPVTVADDGNFVIGFDIDKINDMAGIAN